MALDITQFSAAQLSQVLYIGYFKRAGEREGIEFWEGFLLDEANGPDLLARLVDAADRFADSAEAEADFPFLTATNPSQADIDAFVASNYQNLFNRDPEQAGLEFYRGIVEAELAKDVPKFSNIILDILNGAQNEDLNTVQNKIAASDAYTQALINGSLQYDAAEAENLVDTITNQTADPAQEGTDLAADNAPVSGSASQTFMLTANQSDLVTIDDVGSSDRVTFVVDDNDDSASVFISLNGGLDLTGIEQVSIDTSAGDSFSVPSTQTVQIGGVESITASGSGDVNISVFNHAATAANDATTVDLTGLTGAVFLGEIPGATTYQVGNLGNQASFGAFFSIDLGVAGTDDDFDADGVTGDAVSLLSLTPGATDTVALTAGALGDTSDILVLTDFEGGGDATDDQLDFSAFSDIPSTAGLSFADFNADTDGGTANAVAITSTAFAGTLTLIGVQAGDLNDGDFTFA